MMTTSEHKGYGMKYILMDLTAARKNITNEKRKTKSSYVKEDKGEGMKIEELAENSVEKMSDETEVKVN